LNLRLGLLEQLEGALKLSEPSMALFQLIVGRKVRTFGNLVSEVRQQVLERLTLLLLAFLDMADGRI
jgi:hypothetical protein